MKTKIYVTDLLHFIDKQRGYVRESGMSSPMMLGELQCLNNMETYVKRLAIGEDDNDEQRMEKSNNG